MSNHTTNDPTPHQPTTESSVMTVPTSHIKHTSRSIADTSSRSSTKGTRSSHLDVPSSQHHASHRSNTTTTNGNRPIRRSSTDSILSTFSDLSYLSHEFEFQYQNQNQNQTQSHGHEQLTRKTSNASHQSFLSSTSSTPSLSLSRSNSNSNSHPRPSKFRQKLNNLYIQNYGALLVILSQLFGSGMNVATRLLEQPGPHGPPMHPFQILFVRQSLTALLCTLYAVTTKSIPHFPLGPPDRNVRLLLVARGLFGFFGVFGIYFSLLYLPLSEATVLTFLAPILTCWICSLLLPGERFSRQQQLAGLVSLVGVVFIARPDSLFGGGGSANTVKPVVDGAGVVLGNGTSIVVDVVLGRAEGGSHGDAGVTVPVVTPGQHLLAIGIAMIGVIGATGAITSIRAIGTRAHAFVSINYFSVWSSIVSLFALMVIPSVSFRLPGNLQEWMLLLSLGVCGFCLQGLLTMGLAYNGPAAAAMAAKGNRSVKDSTVSRDGAVTGAEADIEMQNRPGPSSNMSLTGNKRKKLKTNVKKGASGSGNRATSMLYTQILFALSADRIFFGSVPDVWSWIGSGLIVAGAIWVAAAKDTVKVDVNPQSGRGVGNGEEAEVNEVPVEGSSLGLLTRVKSGNGEGHGNDRVEARNGEAREEEVGLLNGRTEEEEEEEREGDDDLDDRLRR